MNRKSRRSSAAQSRNGRNRPKASGPALPPSSVWEQYHIALVHHQAGRLTEAAALCRQILTIDPIHIDSLHLLGVIAHQFGRSDIAIEMIEKAIVLNDRVPEFHNSLGEALRGAGQPDAAVAHYRRALALNPDYAEAHSNFGIALQEQGKLAESITRYGRALALKPDLAETHSNLGNALQGKGQLAEAVAHYMQALTLRPNFVEAHNNLGNALRGLGRLSEAVATFERVLALRPDHAEAHSNLGNVLKEQGKLSEAATHYERALTLKPSFAEAYSNLGSVLQSQGRLDEAVACYRRSLTLKPHFAEARGNLAKALHEQGVQPEAMSHYEQVVALKPDDLGARLALCMAQLPILYEDEFEIEAARTVYQRSLISLGEEIDRRSRLRDLSKVVGMSQPFYLAYQARNDRDCQALYGSLVCRAVAECHPPAAVPGQPREREPVRVGIVSGFFRQHSNWKLPIKGWLSRLDRRRFRVLGYYTGVEEDAETGVAAALCHRFVRGPLSGDGWRQAILEDAPHVLIYPEVGMDPVSARLAAERLAPVQCNSWGHPDTSGFPTLDYFLSSELMEPPDGQEHYTEQLVRLPNLSIYCEPFETRPVSVNRSELGLRATATVYWCGQSLFKYLPQYDWVLPRIARDAGDCQFVFIKYPNGDPVNEQFRTRLNRAFTALGLRLESHCVFLPRLDQDNFVAAAGQCDIVLDSIGWSGCNSTLETLPHNLPIVTVGATLMRGRHSMAILKMMGLSETVAETLDEYVSVAVRLARDMPWRMAIKARIRENKHRIYRDDACISALEDFLDRVARSGLATPSAPRHQT